MLSNGECDLHPQEHPIVDKLLHGMEVSRLRSGRLSGKKNYPTTSWHRPLSARNEHQSHPLAGQAQACGRLIRRMDRGPNRS